MCARLSVSTRACTLFNIDMSVCYLVFTCVCVLLSMYMHVCSCLYMCACVSMYMHVCSCLAQSCRFVNCLLHPPSKQMWLRCVLFYLHFAHFWGLYSDPFYLVGKMCFEKVGSFKDRTQAEDMAKRNEDE